ncbi:MAG: tol-pal system protein YbgF [Marinicaulis sp.]|nr:tol-pal system protein YbgF [Marinicaulis sp.]NNL88241.1 tol-pal system protein YbgF [Marinicaulis sp.]
MLAPSLRFVTLAAQKRIRKVMIMMGRKFKLIAAGGIAVFAVQAPAFAGTKDDVRDLQARMAVVEQAATAQSRSTVKIAELEAQIQALTGQIEELTFQLDQASLRLDSMSAVLAGESPTSNAGTPYLDARGGPVDLTPRDPIADALAQSDASKPGQAPGQALGRSTGGAVELPLDANAAFDYSMGFLLKGDYQSAKSAFQLYVDAFPNHSRTPDAQFRLGEIHLALKENAAAADAFIKHIQQFPNDPRSPEAYLKLGTAFSGLDKPSEACTVFKTMKSKFPNADSAVRERADLEMARINCS